MQWHKTDHIQARQFVCGYCGDKVASKEGYITSDAPDGAQAYLYVCPGCTKPSLIHRSYQSPGVAPGNEVGQARHWFAGALLDLARYKDEDDCAVLAMGFPLGFSTYEGLIKRTEQIRKFLAYQVFWVQADGTVTRELSP